MSARREEIVEVAKGLFARTGYTATTMRDIAEATDLLAGSLYSHFRSKAHLLELVILPFYDELIPQQQEALASEGTGAERTAEMLRRVFRVCADHDAELTILHYDWAHLTQVDELVAVTARSAETLDLWERVIEIGQGDGSLRSAISVPTTVRIITSSIHGVLDRRRYGDLDSPAAARPGVEDRVWVADGPETVVVATQSGVGDRVWVADGPETVAVATQSNVGDPAARDHQALAAEVVEALTVGLAAVPERV